MILNIDCRARATLRYSCRQALIFFLKILGWHWTFTMLIYIICGRGYAEAFGETLLIKLILFHKSHIHSLVTNDQNYQLLQPASLVHELVQKLWRSWRYLSRPWTVRILHQLLSRMMLQRWVDFKRCETRSCDLIVQHKVSELEQRKKILLWYTVPQIVWQLFFVPR